MYSYMPIFLLITLLSLTSFISQRRHVLMCLLSLEAAVLSLALTAGISLSSLAYTNMFLCIMILTLGACEAALALSILVVISRATGSDLIKSTNLNKC